MTANAQWNAYLVAGAFALASELAWAVVSPFYETSIWIVVTPLLSLIGAVYLGFYVFKRPWAYRLSPYFAVAAGGVTALFLGQSDDAYGQYARVMYVVELAVVASSVGLLAVYFLPEIRDHFAQVQPNTSFERTRGR